MLFIYTCDLINVNAVEKIYPIYVLVLNGLILYIVYLLQIFYWPSYSTCCHSWSYITNFFPLYGHVFLAASKGSKSNTRVSS